MKKSQALAALALAFALGLGVVMPVANTYATVVYPNNATQAQKDDLKADVKAANESYADLDDVAAYTNLYNHIEGTNALRQALKNVGDNMIDLTRNGEYIKGATGAKVGDINWNIEALNDLMSYGDDGLYHRNTDGKYVRIKDGRTINQAQLRTLAKISTSDDIDTVLTSMQALLDDAKANATILTDNYLANSTKVQDAVKYNNFVVRAISGWLTQFQGSYAAITAPTSYATSDLKKADENAYNDLVNSDAWKNATKDTVSENYVRFGLYIDAAKATPKYDLVKPLIEAKTNFDKINSNTQAVDYDKALEYIAAFNTAINNYKSGVATTTPDTPNTPVTDTTIKSEDGVVTVSGKLPADARVVASASDKKVTAFGSNKYALYDINIVDGNGNPVKINSNVKVSIKVPSNLNGAKSSIYYYNEDKNTIEKLDAVYSDGVLTYTTNHFSFYAIVEDNGNTITAPITGALAGGENSASTTVAMVAGIATALTAAGAGVVAYRNARRSSKKA